MKLLRRNNLEISKQIGLLAFAFAILLIAFFFNGNHKESAKKAQQVVEAKSSNSPS
ncbi:MAG: hypothetical protein HKO56_06570 [Bacteroidia bacterium]|nr:hypothetical protein [Bacteroidia bacterium]NNM16303.1 hypothetical protein [Bacteroidia bacterium]